MHARERILASIGWFGGTYHRPMTEVLTAADVREAMFSKPQIGKRGYHEDDVDALLDRVAATLDALAKR